MPSSNPFPHDDIMIHGHCNQVTTDGEGPGNAGHAGQRNVMRSLRWLVGGCVSVCASVASAGVYQTVTLDGNLDEWDDAALLYSDAEISDNTNTPDASYSAVYVANDGDNLYIGIRTHGPNGGDILNAWLHTLYLDANATNTTGYRASWMTNGYDFRELYGQNGIQDNLYEFTGATQTDSDWSVLDQFSHDSEGDAMEWSIPLADLDNPTSLVVTLTTKTSPPFDDSWAPSAEANAKTYTVAPVPEPGSLMLTAAGGLLLLCRRRGRLSGLGA